MSLNSLKRISDLVAYSAEIFYDNVQGLVKAVKHREFNQNMFTVLCPVGTIIMYPSDQVPGGWLSCNGQVVSSTTYPDLYSVIGTKFGGDSNNFALPNFVGKFPLMFGSTYGANIASIGGEPTHVLTTSEFPNHTHNILGITGGDNNDNSNTVRFSGGDKNQGDTGFYFTNTQACQSAGSGQAHNNLPPYLSVNFIIKA